MESFLGSCGVFAGCMSTAFYLELLVKADPGCGNLVTFAQFLFITVIGFVFTSKFGTVKRNIPIRNYLYLVGLFFTCNMCSNLAFNFKISMPLHLIFRSGSLIANMLMNIIILKRVYSLSKYLSVALVTLGIIICTFASGKEMKDADDAEEQDSFFWWLLGISILITGLLVSALLSIYQEQLFKNYGKHHREALFYANLLSLPVFLIFSNSIFEHAKIAINSQSTTVPLINIEIPSILYYLFGNVVTQYLCISAVYYLTTEATSLTVTFVVTLRKFVSLLLSIVYFQNTFTFNHWFGTLLVFVGTIIYTEIFPTNKTNYNNL